MVNLEREQQLLRNRVLGWGIVCEEIMPGLDLGRDITLKTGPNGLDFARVEGLDNLAQSLSIALTTLLGSDIFNVQFGFDGLNALAEETHPVLMRERVRIAIIQVLRKDPRVRRIVDVKLGDGQLDLPAPGSRELAVRVVFETVSGDQSAVDVGKIVASALSTITGNQTTNTGEGILNG
jgi:phage baseplate assembly protein W